MAKQHAFNQVGIQPPARRPFRKIFLLLVIVFASYSGYKYNAAVELLDTKLSQHAKRYGYNLKYDYVIPWPWNGVTIYGLAITSPHNFAKPFFKSTQTIATNVEVNELKETINLQFIDAKINTTVLSDALNHYNQQSHANYFNDNPLFAFITAPVSYTIHREYIHTLHYSPEYSGIYSSLSSGNFRFTWNLDKRFNSLTVTMDNNITNVFALSGKIQLGFENSTVPYMDWDNFIRSTVLLKMNVKYQDKGFYPFYVEQLASKLGMDQDWVKRKAILEFDEALATEKISLWPYLKKVTRGFIEQPSYIAIKATPETPLTLRELQLYQQKDLPAVLNLDADTAPL